MKFNGIIFLLVLLVLLPSSLRGLLVFGQRMFDAWGWLAAYLSIILAFMIAVAASRWLSQLRT